MSSQLVEAPGGPVSFPAEVRFEVLQEEDGFILSRITHEGNIVEYATHRRSGPTREGEFLIEGNYFPDQFDAEENFAERAGVQVSNPNDSGPDTGWTGENEQPGDEDEEGS